ncbi:hypothetical protein N864_16460 [Intrasporangium chromatireducens Q5-1]|uniref:NlpC/P60 domain-containing protein n=2 Tax=Intrasporangium TaxID=53357 RepID=W9GP04_9MICO|nr:hypothetical protein N864_16460 [Intrasporangium chromatireducens Q5-1]
MFVGLVLLLTMGTPSPSTPASAACITTGPIPDLSPTQATNARIVYATARARGGHSAAYIAIMTGLTESNLLVLSNPNDPYGAGLPAQGVGYDHDSLGIFQQRPGWGSAVQRMNPTASTNLFIDALLKVPGWQSMPPWRAAQTVQRSAFDGYPTLANGGSSAYGGNYLAQAGRAERITAIIDPAAAQLDCGAADVVPIAASARTEPDAYLRDPTVSGQARTAVMFALAQRGKPYQWGGVGPDSYDCSGLVQTAWRHAGVPIGRVTVDQFRDGVPTTAAALRPGDLVLIPGVDGTIAAPHHIGIYVGQGLVVHAPRTGDVVRLTTLRSFIAKGVSGYRHIG